MTRPVELLTLTAEGTRVDIDVANGSTIRAFKVTPWGNLLAERTSPYPLRASQSASYGDEQLDWLSDYDGGWHVLFPNAGPACEVDGVALPFHGEASRARWEVVDADTSTATLSTPCRLPVTLTRRIEVSAGSVLVRETAANSGTTDVHVVWGQHPVFPATPGTRIDLPGGRIHVDAGYNPAGNDLVPGACSDWPAGPGKGGDLDLSVIPEGRCERYLAVTDIQQGWAVVRDPARGVGVSVSFGTDVFPLLWLWVEAEGTEFPWLGNVRYLGVEPHSSWPGTGLAAAVDEGRATVIPAGGEVTAWTRLTAFAASQDAVTALSGDGTPTAR